MQQVGEKFTAVADRLVRLVHDAEIEAEFGGAGRLGEGLAALIGGEDDAESVVFPFQPDGDFLRVGEAGHAEILAQHCGVIALDAPGGFIAAHADPIHGLMVGQSFAQPAFERLPNEREARHGDDDAAGGEIAGDPI